MGVIPQKIIVGFNNRAETYTGKLGYVCYLSGKNLDTVKQAKSFYGWIDDKIPTETFDNEPTTGFVLNHSAGGSSWGWNGRVVKARVYDPRGFEFEIDMENLLYILEYSDSYKGKALEGEFVYAWMGSGSVFLLSCNSSEYKNLTKVVDKIETPLLKMAELEPFKTYKRIGGGDAIYLGDVDEVDIYQQNLWSFTSKKHPFFDLTNKQVQYPKDIICISDNQVDFKTVKHKYSHRKHYLAEKRSIKLKPHPIKLILHNFQNKHHSDSYVLYPEDPNAIDNLPTRSFIHFDGRLYNITKYSKNDKPLNYFDKLFIEEIETSAGVDVNWLLKITNYPNDFTIDDKGIIVSIKGDRKSLDCSKLADSYDNKPNKIYTTEFGKLIEI